MGPVILNMCKKICAVRIILKSLNLSTNEVASEHVLASKCVEIEIIYNALMMIGNRALSPSNIQNKAFSRHHHLVLFSPIFESFCCIHIAIRLYDSPKNVESLLSNPNKFLASKLLHVSHIHKLSM